MIKIVRKWFWAWEDDKEEQFLEKMAADGYKLNTVQLGKYTFVEDKPAKIKYQLDFKGLGRMKEDEYLQIFEDAGWECIDTLGSWYYFRKEYTDDEPDISIFSDNKSRLEKYWRIIAFLMISGFPLYYNVLILFPNLDSMEFEFPGFYFFFRIIAVILLVIHSLAVIRIIFRILKDRNKIRE